MLESSNDEAQKGNVRLLVARIPKAILKKIKFMSYVERTNRNDLVVGHFENTKLE